jgi:hypothetical protein
LHVGRLEPLAERGQHIPSPRQRLVEQATSGVIAVYHRGVFLADYGPEEEALQVYEDWLRRNHAVSRMNMNYALLLFQRGAAEKAAEVVDRWVPAGMERDATLAFVVAELPDGQRRARQICDAMSGEPAELVIVLRCGILHYLGEKDKACNLVRQFKPKFEYYPPNLMKLYQYQLDYLRQPDEAAAKKWLATVLPLPRLQGYIYPFIGLTRLGEGDRAAARRHFEAGQKVRDPYYPTCMMNSAILARMNRDPNWPPWIPVKSQ